MVLFFLNALLSTVQKRVRRRAWQKFSPHGDRSLRPANWAIWKCMPCGCEPLNSHCCGRGICSLPGTAAKIPQSLFPLSPCCQKAWRQQRSVRGSLKGKGDGVWCEWPNWQLTSSQNVIIQPKKAAKHHLGRVENITRRQEKYQWYPDTVNHWQKYPNDPLWQLNAAFRGVIIFIWRH